MKVIALTAFALLAAATAAQAGTASPQTSGMKSRQVAMPVRAAKAPVIAKKVVVKTIVREVPVVPETMMVREPVTRWVPGIFGPYPITTIEDREVYTGKYQKMNNVATPGALVTAPAYQTLDDDGLPLGYVVRY